MNENMSGWVNEKLYALDYRLWDIFFKYGKQIKMCYSKLLD